MRQIPFILAILTALAALADAASAGAIRQTKGDHYDAFRQLRVDLPTPNRYRSASGAPGPEYWQQRADYDIEVTLDEAERRIQASETIRYHNNSPATLEYLWVQLDQNRFRDRSTARRSQTAREYGVFPKPPDMKEEDILTYEAIARKQAYDDAEHGFEIASVTGANGAPLDYTIVDTMMRIDLAEPLASGGSVRFSIDWSFNILDQARIDSRGGYEHFPGTDTDIFFLAQWFPRMAAYTDYGGWQHKAFLGTGEFTLEFGSYEVAITVPADHIVAASGVLRNPQQVLTAEQRRRLDSANTEEPVFVVTPAEAAANEREGTRDMKTWRFRAKNVRDFAWASSRKFIWDAMIHEQPGAPQPEVLAMSFYPNEGEPIWSDYSTHAVVHTLDVYSRFTFPYPYPTAQSVNTWESGGMEYPMITFNGYRPEPFEEDEETAGIIDPPDETWSRRIHYKLTGVVMHEIGHMYFPMIVNNDERQWSWMDEGLNSFLEYMAELEWGEDFPAYDEHVNVLDAVTEYMTSEQQVPIMTQADATLQRSPNAYTKPTAALVVLRETVLGRELFDHAFREYARRWMFKRPRPADFFRTIEDASGTDLDWFWRGWFYSTDHVDVGISDVRQYQVSTRNPDVESGLAREEREREVPEPLQSRNREEGRETYLEWHPGLRGFYSEHDRFTVTNADRKEYRKLLEELEDWEREALRRAAEEQDYVYFIDFENRGGLPTPLPLTITYENGDAEALVLPAETWRRSHRSITKVLIRENEIASIELDRRHLTADADYSNNHFPRRIERSRIELYKEEEEERNLMRDQLVPLEQ